MITLLSECIFVDHALNKTNTIYCKKLQLQKEKETSNFEVETKAKFRRGNNAQDPRSLAARQILYK